MPRPSRPVPRFLLSGALGLLAATVAVGLPPAAEPPAAARAEAPLPTALTYVPHDAALFVYADVASVWKSDLAKTFRGADKDTFAKLEEGFTTFTGSKLDDLKSLVIFAPKMRGPEDSEKFAFVLTFTKAHDADKLTAAAKELFGKNAKLRVSAPTDKVAIVLLGLGEEYAKPQPANAEGHLTPAIKAAAAGTHALVAGATMSNLPEELTRDDLPAQVRQFQPIFKSHSAYLTLDLGKSLALNVRVKAKRPGAAVDAEKALAALAKLIVDEAGTAVPDLKADAKDKPGLTDLVKVLEAALVAAKGAKYTVDGNEARATLTLPLDGLPLASAYKAAVARVNEAGANIQSANNLKQIALAMHGYHDATGAFPPASVVGKKGKPQLSWRVLILPYIDQNALYKEFKLDEPWDSENNKKLIAKMPKVYAIPGKTGPNGTDTHYRAFVGNGAVWDWVMGTKITNITDGTSNTLMVVTAATAVPWTKPDELEFDADQDMTKLIGLVVNGRAQVAMCDGSVRTLKKLPDRKTLSALITKNGGEVIPNDF